MGLRSHYLVRHRGGFRFQMGVPADLQEFVGRKMWRCYLGARSEPEARLAALHLAVKCRREIDRLRKLPSNQKLQFAAQSCPLNAADFAFSQPLASTFEAVRPVTTLDQTLVRPCEVFTSIADLVAIWQRVAQPRAAFSVLRMKRCAHELMLLTGDIAAGSVTRAHIMQYRDKLEAKGYARGTGKNYLDGIHRLFAIALSEGIVETNPAAGIKIRSGRDKFVERERRRPFEAGELALLMAALASEPEPFIWMVRLLLHHGMRSGEVAQLQVEDITKVTGVSVIRIHDRHGSLKNRNSRRDIPIHPNCSDFIDYVRTVRGPWVFPQETLRSDRFQRLATDFIRKKAKLADRTLTMHSLRHTWRTAAREISMPAAVSRAIMGHSLGRDVHDDYGGGPSLRLMAEWMSKIEIMIKAD